MNKSNKEVKIFTFGWSPEFVIRPLLKEGISGEDIIVIITSKPEDEYAKKRAEESYEQVLSFLKVAGVKNVDYREVELNKEFLDICRDIAGIVKEFTSAKKLTFYLTGGMRILVLATFIVAQLFLAIKKDVELSISREDRPLTFPIPIKLVGLDFSNFTEAQIKILKLLKAYKEATFKDLATDRTEVTVRKHLVKLREKGVVEYKTKGRKQIYNLSKLGELLLQLIG